MSVCRYCAGRWWPSCGGVECVFSSFVPPLLSSSFLHPLKPFPSVKMCDIWSGSPCPPRRRWLIRWDTVALGAMRWLGGFLRSTKTPSRSRFWRVGTQTMMRLRTLGVEMPRIFKNTVLKSCLRTGFKSVCGAEHSGKDYFRPEFHAAVGEHGRSARGEHGQNGCGH